MKKAALIVLIIVITFACVRAVATASGDKRQPAQPS